MKLKEIPPYQRQNLSYDMRDLEKCLDAEDWAGAYLAAIDVKWGAAMLAKLALENARTQ